MSGSELRHAIKSIDQLVVYRFLGNVMTSITKILSEYDQKISQLQTADKPMAPPGRVIAITRHQEDRLSNATSSLFSTKMIA